MSITLAARSIRDPSRAAFYAALYLRRSFARAFKAEFLRVYGSMPDRTYLSWKVFCYLGLHLYSNRSEKDCRIAFYHNDATFSTPPHDASGAINARCVDISKGRVQSSFLSVFGYPLEVDPQHYVGKILCKSNYNATHDAIIIDGPISHLDPGRVYQRAVDNSHGTGSVLDFRVPIVGNEIPYVVLKYRPIEHRFSNVNSRATVSAAPKEFSADEIRKLTECARQLGLDFGEMDVLRDNVDGRLYVVDVNCTPKSPTALLYNRAGFSCVRAAALSFRRQFLLLQ